MGQFFKQIFLEIHIYIKFLIQVLKGESESELATVDIVFISFISIVVICITLLMAIGVLHFLKEFFRENYSKTWLIIAALIFFIVFFFYF